MFSKIIIALAILEGASAFTFPTRKLTRTTCSMSLQEPPQSTSKKATTKTVITKNIKQPDPVPAAGVAEAVALMESGMMYRYTPTSAEDSVVSLCEQEIGQYTGHDYVVALNSCGSALFLAMKCAGVKPGDKVLTNAFTFTAVPSAIEHAGAKAVYVETDSGFRIDIDDLEKKMDSSGAKYLMVSHMRGKIADMDRIAELCDAKGVYLIEDAAHAIGVKWKGKHMGHHGRISAISSQSYKMLNSGEGGFLITNDPDAGARAAVYAGAYEQLHGKHIMVPDAEAFGDLPNELPNYSLRMHAVTAAIIRPQIETIDARREQYNVRYYALADKLNALGPQVTVPPQHDEVTIVGDSMQITFTDATKEQIEAVLQGCKSRGLPTELFGASSNARYFKNWKFLPADCDLPQTEKIIKTTVDVRMPLQWEDEDFDVLFQVLVEAMTDAGILA